MPCDTITTVGIELGKVDPGLLFKALEALQLYPKQQGEVIYFRNGQYNVKTGQCDIRLGYGESTEAKTAEIKRAYSHQVIQATAKKMGWTLKQTSENKYQVIKQSY